MLYFSTFQIKMSKNLASLYREFNTVTVANKKTKIPSNSVLRHCAPCGTELINRTELTHGTCDVCKDKNIRQMTKRKKNNT